MFRIKIVLTFILSCCAASTFAASIKGKIVLTEDWAPVIYISEIQAFENLHTASYDFLRYQVNLDSTGYFEVRDLEMVAEDRIYRLHICKKGDPVSTILIGGQEENFIHFLMNETTDITITHAMPSKGLHGCTVTGHPAEKELSKVFELYKRLNTPLDLPSVQNRKFVKDQIYKEWHSIADTGENAVVRLLATHLSMKTLRGMITSN